MNADSPVTLSSFIRRREEPIQATLDGELILMSVETGCYFDLDPISADIWGRIVGSVRVSDLVSYLAARYEGDPLQIQDDVLEFLTFLAENGLIETEQCTTP